jgi:hypothetical protein
MRSLISLLLVSFAALCLAVGSSSQTAADRVTLQVDAPSIDGAITFADTASSWTYTCAQPHCAVTASRGAILTITANPTPSSPWSGWGDACAATGSQSTCTVQMNSDVTYVSGRFAYQRLWLPTFGFGTITVSLPGSNAPAGGRSDWPTGQQLVLRAVPRDDNYRMTAWGGACANVTPSHGCIITLNRSLAVSATFELKPPPCPPGQSCDPIVSTTQVRLTVTGDGSVVVPKQGINPQITCPGGRTCSFDRAVDRPVYLTAATARHVVWGGSYCRGFTGLICKFGNSHGDSQISVTFR